MVSSYQASEAVPSTKPADPLATPARLVQVHLVNHPSHGARAQALVGFDIVGQLWTCNLVSSIHADHVSVDAWQPLIPDAAVEEFGRAAA